MSYKISKKVFYIVNFLNLVELIIYTYILLIVSIISINVGINVLIYRM